MDYSSQNATLPDRLSVIGQSIFYLELCMWVQLCWRKAAFCWLWRKVSEVCWALQREWDFFNIQFPSSDSVTAVFLPSAASLKMHALPWSIFRATYNSPVWRARTCCWIEDEVKKDHASFLKRRIKEGIITLLRVYIPHGLTLIVSFFQEKFA